MVLTSKQIRPAGPHGVGLLKGLAVTLKTLLTPAVTTQYPHEKPTLHPRTRGVIALMEENCTVCMLCAIECPDWCIYIESHKETVPSAEGGRTRTRNQLDRFAIDFALCMYCGICVEVCPFDALFWSPEFEYSTYEIGELTHEAGQLREWMDTVPPPPPLEEGAEPVPEVARELEKAAEERERALAEAARRAAEAAEGGPAEAGEEEPAAAEEEIEVEAQVDEEVYQRLVDDGVSERVARAKAKAAYVRQEKARLRRGREQARTDAAPPPAGDGLVPVQVDLESSRVDRGTYEQLIAAGKSQRVALATAKAVALASKDGPSAQPEEGG